MKTNRYYIFFFALLFIISISCEDWLDINQDPDSPERDAVTENVLLPGILSEATYELTGGTPARYPNYWVGQLAESQSPPHEVTFDINPSDFNNIWTNTLYTEALKNSVLMTKIADENGNAYYESIGKISSAYMLGIAVDCFGDVPWSQAFQPDEYNKPVFDSQESLYTSIQTILDEAIQLLSSAEDGQLRRPGDEDLLYEGDIILWKKLAYAIKARYAMRLTYAPGKTGTGQADLVLDALKYAFESSEDDADFDFLNETDAESPWNQWDEKWSVHLHVNEFMFGIMDSLNDPRIPVYFVPSVSTDTIAGHQNGIIVSNEDDASLLNPEIIAADRPVSWITFAELKFLEAEAQLWKGNKTAAKTALDTAITANMTKLGVTADDIQTYIDGLGALPDDFEEAQEMIITQKYLANFLSTENWCEYRRTGYPAISSQNTTDPTHNHIPLRYIYPNDVKLSNTENVPDIDWLTDRLWWDTKNRPID